MPTPSAGDPGKRISHEGKHRHFWVTALANPAAPTVAELTGRISLLPLRSEGRCGVHADRELHRLDRRDRGV
jgi:hypothetical protein